MRARVVAGGRAKHTTALADKQESFWRLLGNSHNKERNTKRRRNRNTVAMENSNDSASNDKKANIPKKFDDELKKASLTSAVQRGDVASVRNLLCQGTPVEHQHLSVL